jgi:hypothetical protein
MRNSLSTRAAAAFAVVLSPSLGAEAAFAHGSASFRPPAMHAGIVRGHGQAQGWRNGPRRSWSWRGQYGGNRFAGGGWFWNGGGFYGDGFSYAPYGYAYPAGGGVGGGTLVVVGAPTLGVFPGAGAGVADPGPQGGCVIHKLAYDKSGNYVGERQTSGC